MGLLEGFSHETVHPLGILTKEFLGGGEKVWDMGRRGFDRFHIISGVVDLGCVIHGIPFKKLASWDKEFLFLSEPNIPIFQHSNIPAVFT